MSILILINVIVLSTLDCDHTNQLHSNNLIKFDVFSSGDDCLYVWSTGYMGITMTTSLGIFTGAEMSKNIASFLEENELFVPSDDDDDDWVLYNMCQRSDTYETTIFNFFEMRQFIILYFIDCISYEGNGRYMKTS